MLAVFVVGLVAVIAASLVVMGFVANTARHEESMRSPGCYWTWAMVAGLVLGAATGTPFWAMAAGFVVLLATAGIWVYDDRRREMAK